MFYSPIFSFVLTQIFGVYLLIVAMVMISRVAFFRHLVATLEPNNIAITLFAALGLLLGLILVDLHNIWVFAPRVIVTLLCWFILIKSLLWLAMPEQMITMAQAIYRGRGYYLIILLMAALGIVLVVRGFYLFETRYIMSHMSINKN